jgi:pimeloyl-ACP methyl ester carboxylesterase
MSEPTTDLIATALERRQDRYVSLQGMRFRYWDVGTGPETILLVHGLGASIEAWVANIEVLARHYRVLALDLPGHGRSDKAGHRLSLSFATEIVTEFLDRVGAPKIHLVGNSMGGLVCLEVALAHPARIDRLVLADSAGLGRELALVARLASLPFVGWLPRPPWITRLVVRWVLRQLLSNANELPQALVDRWVELALLPGSVAALFQAVRFGIDLGGQKRSVILVDRLAELSMPTLIVWGTADPLIPVAHGERAHRLIRGSRLELFPGRRHCPPLEEPARFNELLLSFLSRSSIPLP